MSAKIKMAIALVGMQAAATADLAFFNNPMIVATAVSSFP